MYLDKIKYKTFVYIFSRYMDNFQHYIIYVYNSIIYDVFPTLELTLNVLTILKIFTDN